MWLASAARRQHEPPPNYVDPARMPQLRHGTAHIRACTSHQLCQVSVPERQVDQRPRLVRTTKKTRELNQLYEHALAEWHREQEALLQQEPSRCAADVDEQLPGVRAALTHVALHGVCGSFSGPDRPVV